MHPTSQQVMCALQQIVHDQMRIRVPFTEQTRLHEYFEHYGVGDDFDVFQLLDALDEVVGLEFDRRQRQDLFWGGATSHKQWLAEVAPTRTFGWLADEIAQRVDIPSMEPANLLGRPCKAAGVFLGIEQVVREIQPKAARFAPSTPIRDRLRGQTLRRFWRRLEWVTQDRIDALPEVHQVSPAWDAATYAVAAVGWLVCFTIIAAFLVGAWTMPCSWNQVGGTIATIAAVSLAVISGGVIYARLFNYLDFFANPLPAGVVTFRDLVRHLQRRPPAIDG